MKQTAPIFLLMLFAAAAPLCAQEVIWVALVKADARAGIFDDRIVRLQPRLERIFGYPAYHLVGEARVPTAEKYAQWILPRKDFYLKMEPLAPRPEIRNVIQIELYCNNKQVIQARFQPHPRTPLFISGPDYNDGRLIFILQPLPSAP